MPSFKMDDYVDVAERIGLFYAKYPDGRLSRMGEPKVLPVGDKLFIMYTAKAYRTPDDPLPGIGTAWEPFPGPTQFTKDSELMNAETAAWGRAIIAAGIGSKKIASAEEVRNRQPEQRVEVPATPIGDAKAAELLMRSDDAGITRTALAKSVSYALGMLADPVFDDDAAALAVLSGMSEPVRARVEKWIGKQAAKAPA